MKPVAWEAEDGTVFNSETDCKKYEESCRKKRNLKSRFYCQDGTRLFPEVEDGGSLYSQCWYIYIANDEEIGVINELLGTNFTESGVYLYDDAYGGFRHTNELYAQIHKAFVTVEE